MIDVDPRHTSDRCDACGNGARENRVKRRCSDASAVGTRPTPRNTPPATSSGLDWPFSQPTKLGEKKLTALAVREVTWAGWSVSELNLYSGTSGVTCRCCG